MGGWKALGGMRVFTPTVQASLTLWRGTPDCQAAHDYLLERLTHITGGQFRAVGSPLTNRIKGNLGEVSAFWLGREGPHAGLSHVFTMNCHQPLLDISLAGVDIVWISFNDQDQTRDFAVLQEVKTTSGISLDYADTLVDDYTKLFSIEMSLTLQSRFQSIKNRLEFEHDRPDLCLRLNALAGQAPDDSTRVRLLPTLVHEAAGKEPSLKLATVRTSLVNLGWSAGQISEWSIALTDLDERLKRLSWGRH